MGTLLAPVLIHCGGGPEPVGSDELDGQSQIGLSYTSQCVAGSNFIQGTTGNDTIVGSAGDDCIFGGGGNDAIFGGLGNDRIWGEAGEDFIDGGDGNDKIWGGQGNDVLAGGTGRDEVLGMQGDDHVTGGTDNDIVGGNEGNDFVDGEAGDDSVYGHEGNDRVFGGVGNDSVRGGDGDDIISDSVGTNRFFSQPGCDVTNGVADSECPAPTVASGDATQTSVMLLASTTVESTLIFTWSDPNLSAPLGQATVVVSDPAIPAKVMVTGLEPGTRYEYVVTAGVPAHGRFRTAPANDSDIGIRFGVSGDWRGELAPFPAARNIASRDLDFFVTLGDTIYADYPSPDLNQPQALTLGEFRIKHNEVYSPRAGLNTLADARASTAWFATIDDHEVTDDFAGGAAPSSDSRFAAYEGAHIHDTELFTNGLRAFYEYNPIETLSYGSTGDARTQGKPKLYRTRRYGTSAATFLLDARTFRDQGLPAVADPFDSSQIFGFLVSSFDPSRTMLGAAQLEELERDLLVAQAEGVTWKFVLVPEPIQNLGVLFASDRYEGYAAERSQLLGFIDNAAIENVVFVAADIHGTIVNNLTYQTEPGGPQIPVSSFEISTGAIAFDAPLGPTTTEIAAAVGLIDSETYSAYLGLPTEFKDVFVQQLIDAQMTPFGYDPLGIEPESGIDATLIEGGYVAAHVFGWTELEIAPTTHNLRITTYGIDAYGVNDASNPASYIGREPAIVSQFEVRPK